MMLLYDYAPCIFQTITRHIICTFWSYLVGRTPYEYLLLCEGISHTRRVHSCWGTSRNEQEGKTCFISVVEAYY